MTEKISNKELAGSLLQIYTESDSLWTKKRLELAAERLEAMPDVGEQEPKAWFTEDYEIDKSATTYDKSIAERWMTKGWPVFELYTQPQPPAPDENAVNELMQERDSLELMLDRLSSSVAVLFGEDVGEHTSANYPWENAIELLDRRSKTPDKDTIKRYCLEFLHFGCGKPSFSRADEDLFEKWWQQQSAEGGE